MIFPPEKSLSITFDRRKFSRRHPSSEEIIDRIAQDLGLSTEPVHKGREHTPLSDNARIKRELWSSQGREDSKQLAVSSKPFDQAQGRQKRVISDQLPVSPSINLRINSKQPENIKKSDAQLRMEEFVKRRPPLNIKKPLFGNNEEQHKKPLSPNDPEGVEVYQANGMVLSPGQRPGITAQPDHSPNDPDVAVRVQPNTLDRINKMEQNVADINSAKNLPINYQLSTINHQLSPSPSSPLQVSGLPPEEDPPVADSPHPSSTLPDTTSDVIASIEKLLRESEARGKRQEVRGSKPFGKAQGGQLPVNSEQAGQAVSSKQLAVSSEQEPVNSEQLPVSSEQEPVNSEQLPVSSEQEPVNSEQLAVSSEQAESLQVLSPGQRPGIIALEKPTPPQGSTLGSGVAPLQGGALIPPVPQKDEAAAQLARIVKNKNFGALSGINDPRETISHGDTVDSEQLAVSSEQAESLQVLSPGQRPGITASEKPTPPQGSTLGSGVAPLQGALSKSPVVSPKDVTVTKRATPSFGKLNLIASATKSKPQEIVPVTSKPEKVDREQKTEDRGQRTEDRVQISEETADSKQSEPDQPNTLDRINKMEQNMADVDPVKKTKSSQKTKSTPKKPSGLPPEANPPVADRSQPSSVGNTSPVSKPSGLRSQPSSLVNTPARSTFSGVVIEKTETPAETESQKEANIFQVFLSLIMLALFIGVDCYCVLNTVPQYMIIVRILVFALGFLYTGMVVWRTAGVKLVISIAILAMFLFHFNNRAPVLSIVEKYYTPAVEDSEQSAVSSEQTGTEDSGQISEDSGQDVTANVRGKTEIENQEPVDSGQVSGLSPQPSSSSPALLDDPVAEPLATDE